MSDSLKKASPFPKYVIPTEKSQGDVKATFAKGKPSEQPTAGKNQTGGR